METYPSQTNHIFEPDLERVPHTVGQALHVMARELAACGVDWLVGGSVGILLQGVALPAAPRDLDVYIDESGASTVHRALARYAIDEQAGSETDMYRSVLSHYAIEGVQVELVGGFHVRTEGSDYKVEVDRLLVRHARAADLGGVTVRFMPLMHELLFNVLRGRPDRYEPIAASLRAHPAKHAVLLDELVRANKIAAPHVEQLQHLLGLPESGGTLHDA